MDWTPYAEKSKDPTSNNDDVSTKLVGSTDYRTAPVRIRVIRSHVKKLVPRKNSSRIIRWACMLAVVFDLLSGVLALFRPFEGLTIVWFVAAAGLIVALWFQYERKVVEVEKEIDG